MLGHLRLALTSHVVWGSKETLLYCLSLLDTLDNPNRPIEATMTTSCLLYRIFPLRDHAQAPTQQPEL
jgi:hypothetical protein